MNLYGAKLIERRIREQNAKNEVSLIPYITAYDPDKASTLEFLRYLAETEPASIELGFPFSDPVADGPTIQKAVVRALKNLPTFEDYLDLVHQFKTEFPQIPLLCMTYYNIVYRFGLERAVNEALKAGLDGFIIPDLPIEEARPWLKVNRGKGLATVFLAAPTSSPERIKKIARYTRGFLYYVSLTGITGARDRLPEDLVSRLETIRGLIRVPLAVGFGISKREHVTLLKPYASSLVIGSALVNIIEKEGKKAGPHLRAFLLELKNEGN